MKMARTLAAAVAALSIGSALAAPETRAEKVALARELAANGIVLLKNDGNVLPLKTGQEIALVGVTGYCCHRMGWGSGDMLAHEPVQYDAGLESAGIKLHKGFADIYRKLRDERAAKGEYARINRDWYKWTVRFGEPDLYREKFAAVAGDNRGMTCVVVIGRNAGESEDLTDGPGSWRLFWEEDLLLAAACKNFDNVVVLLNACGVIDTSFVEKYPIKGLVYTSLLGEVSGDAVADVLTGKVNPSGKTVDTWAKHYYEYPSTACMSAFEVPYSEGTFVGYRHFDRAGIEPRYPFGFGLSYTTFGIGCGTAAVAGTKVTLPVAVSNTGARDGSEVVQVYLSRTGGNSKIPEAVRRLCAFRKTQVIAAGKSAALTLSFDLAENALYDAARARWMLPAGTYELWVGNSSRNLKKVHSFKLRETVVQQAKNLRFGKDAPASVRTELPKPTSDKILTLQDVLAGQATLEDVVAQFNDGELVSIVNGRLFKDGYAVAGGTGVGGVKNEGRVACEAGEFWSSEKYGIPALTTADGPSGVRLGNFNEPVTNYNPICATMVAWPCGTALAQGWDPSAAEKFGRAVAEDMALADIDGWLAPGVNIHRNPLCGRNFEYFSEDPIVAGLVGAGVVRGVQTLENGKNSGRFATVKHFCANNQEFFRNEQTDLVDEQTLREIYLKPFEIVVKTARPVALMTSYNQINGDYAATTASLLTDVLRGEWGFDGVVMTDWWCSSDKLRHPSAGNDVVMPGVPADWKAMREALADGRMKRADLQNSAVQVLKAVLNRLRAK
jgi:beta-glucosidase